LNCPDASLWPVVLDPFHGRCIDVAASVKHSPPKRLRSIRNGSVWEAESNIDLLALVSIPAASDRNPSFTVERINL
jgi:hypothetical protein